MATTNEIVESFARGVIEGIKDNIRNKQVTPYGAMNATGSMADSLGYTWDGNRLTIFSNKKHFTVLETGRKAGKFPPLETIEKWIEDKPVILQDITKKSLAYLIARKISEEGSLLYRQGGNSGVISDFINDNYVKKNLTDNLFKSTIETIINEHLRQN